MAALLPPSVSCSSSFGVAAAPHHAPASAPTLTPVIRSRFPRILPIVTHASSNELSVSKNKEQYGKAATTKIPTNDSVSPVQALSTHATQSGAFATTIVESLPIAAWNHTTLQTKIAKPIQDDSFVEVAQHNAQEMKDWIEEIRGMFQTMSLGEISVSPYDTAWVAMVPSLTGSEGPQFPRSLDWIINNQLQDGSWGDEDMFLSYDRVCSTVACLVALKTWNTGHNNIAKGLEFVHSNLAKMKDEVDDYMPIGFEVVFPTMLDDAKDLGLDLPYDSTVVMRIREERDRKLKSIPMELLHSHPTTLLHSLEGLHHLVNWERLLRLQSKNGSFLFSPASTACALKYTGDTKCLNYLNSILEKFSDAVPNVYPVDLFEHLWVVDRLERLGISRYFKSEIKQCLDYVFKYWTSKGIAWASESEVCDADDTAMAFRLLRLHGYPVSPEAFRSFKKGKEFFCFEGQTSQAVTGMFNLYRASQTMVPGESILEEMNQFTRAFLLKRHNNNEIQDKWIISKGLKGEVEYTLNNPWYQSLPRLESRNYIEHYGVDDVWIGKSLYKMYFVNNQVFLNLARADYNLCQSFHQRELAQLLRWYDQCQLTKLKFAHQTPIESFFSIAATLFEPEFSVARNVWAMCNILTTTIFNFFDIKGSLAELRSFLDALKKWDSKLAEGFSPELKIIFLALYNTTNRISQEALVAQGQDNLSTHLRQVWIQFVTSMLEGAEWKLSSMSPTLEQYMHSAKIVLGLEPIVHSTIFFVGEKLSKEEFQHNDFQHFMDLLSTFGLIRNDIQNFHNDPYMERVSCLNLFLKDNPKASRLEAIQHFQALSEQTMRLIVKEYLETTKLPKQCKQVYFYMAKIINYFHNKTDGFRSKAKISEDAYTTLYTSILPKHT